MFIDNDVNACALGERMYGCCKDTDDFAWITISNGVGGAIFSSGQLIRGFSNGAGEIGHIVVEPDGNLCPCSHRGCLEATRFWKSNCRCLREDDRYAEYS